MRRPNREGMVLPGELPGYEHVIAYLKRVEPGFGRWLLAIAAAFGTRISESVLAQRCNFLGKLEISERSARNDLVDRINERYQPALFLVVDEAEKAPLSNAIVETVLGGGVPDTDPKGGPYTAVCVDERMARLIIELMRRGEHKRGEDFAVKANVYTFMKRLPSDDSEYKFNEWNMHDYRRFSITEKGLRWGNMWDVAQVHGQATEAMARRYFQWGLIMRRKGTDETSDLELINEQGESDTPGLENSNDQTGTL